STRTAPTSIASTATTTTTRRPTATATACANSTRGGSGTTRSRTISATDGRRRRRSRGWAGSRRRTPCATPSTAATGHIAPTRRPTGTTAIATTTPPTTSRTTTTTPTTAPPIATGPTPAAATRAANGTTTSRPTSAAAGTGSAANRAWAGKRPSTRCAMPGTASNAHCREMPTATDADPRDLDPRQPSETPLRRGFACPRAAFSGLRRFGLHRQRSHGVEQAHQQLARLFPRDHVRRTFEPHAALVRRVHAFQPVRGRLRWRGVVVAPHEHHHRDRELAHALVIDLEELGQDAAEGEHVARVDRLRVGCVVLGRQQRRTEEIPGRCVTIRGHAAVELRPLARDDDPLAGDRLVARVRRDRFELGDRFGVVVLSRLLQTVLEADALVVAHLDDLADADVGVEQVRALERGAHSDHRAPAVPHQDDLVLAQALAHVPG